MHGIHFIPRNPASSAADRPPWAHPIRPYTGIRLRAEYIIQYLASDLWQFCINRVVVKFSLCSSCITLPCKFTCMEMIAADRILRCQRCQSSGSSLNSGFSLAASCTKVWANVTFQAFVEAVQIFLNSNYWHLCGVTDLADVHCK